jgi:hypothetical protein
VTFAERKHLAESHEFAIRVELERRGWTVEPFGIALLSDHMRQALRQVQPLALWRWLPDLIATRDRRTVLVDGKDEQRNDTPNFAVEETAILAHRTMATLGVPIVYVFSDMSCNFNCDDLLNQGRRVGPTHGGSRVQGAAGSGTPFWLLPKRHQLHLDEVFGAPLDDLLW